MIDFLDDGRIRIELDEGPCTFRRPKYGQFKSYRLALQEMGADVERLREKFQIGYSPLDGTDTRVVDRLDDETDDGYRARVDEFNDASNGLLLGFWRKIASDLGDTDWPADDDDVPAFLVFGTNTVTAVFRHWQTVPLAPGQLGAG